MQFEINGYEFFHLLKRKNFEIKNVVHQKKLILMMLCAHDVTVMM